MASQVAMAVAPVAISTASSGIYWIIIIVFILVGLSLLSNGNYLIGLGLFGIGAFMAYMKFRDTLPKIGGNMDSENIIIGNAEPEYKKDYMEILFKLQVVPTDRIIKTEDEFKTYINEHISDIKTAYKYLQDKSSIRSMFGMLNLDDILQQIQE